LAEALKPKILHEAIHLSKAYSHKSQIHGNEIADSGVTDDAAILGNVVIAAKAGDQVNAGVSDSWMPRLRGHDELLYK
jgi:hypothetical protein